MREHRAERVLVALTRSATDEVVLDAAVLALPPAAVAHALLDGDDLAVQAGRLRLPAVDGPSGRLWHLPASGFAPAPSRS